MRAFSKHRTRGLVMVLLGAAVLTSAPASSGTVPQSTPTESEATASYTKSAIEMIVVEEAGRAGLPPDIALAVVHVESGYDPTVIGRVGEIGLMQVRPGTAAMLGFKGSAFELAKPDVNIHYGVTYLGKAWRLANGDLCRALMKYRAGHGEETMTPLSVTYCDRARRFLASLKSPFAGADTASIAKLAPLPAPAALKASAGPAAAAVSPVAVYARYKQGTPAASRAFWSAQEARVSAIKARVRAKWSRVASR